MSTKKQANGVNTLNEQQEEMRMKVVDLEIKARYWKAQWEIKHYTLEGVKLDPAYEEYVKVEQEKSQKAYEEFMKAMQDSKGAIKVEDSEGKEIDSELLSGISDINITK